MEYAKYTQSMNLIYELEDQKLTKVDGIKVSTVYDCFGHCDQNNEPVFDIEFVSISGKYYHLWNVSINRLTFEEA